VRRISVFLTLYDDICKLIRQLSQPAPPVVALASKLNQWLYYLALNL